MPGFDPVACKHQRRARPASGVSVASAVPAARWAGRMALPLKSPTKAVPGSRAMFCTTVAAVITDPVAATGRGLISKFILFQGHSGFRDGLHEPRCYAGIKKFLYPPRSELGKSVFGKSIVMRRYVALRPAPWKSTTAMNGASSYLRNIH